MSELRSQVVEAMAQAAYERRRWAYPRWARWDMLSDDEKRPWLLEAEAALDAALDVLGERVTEWDAAAADEATLVQLRPSPADYLAVLRAGKGSDE